MLPRTGGSRCAGWRVVERRPLPEVPVPPPAGWQESVRGCRETHRQLLINHMMIAEQCFDFAIKGANCILSTG
ncbi:hypothetical protein APX01_16980 [Cereibacter sphaeroides]|nr:hypothetical protein APX01_16980 [Cereibacter sphaeroides]ANS35966.1 hypothetical protein A3858_16980 [Cereibacter sphaeroides]ATN65030.1 hypothetical protein A3857_16995 [Cereibacter sphaeroides]AXC63229.1 hypothetical protein DQL45_17715 [Cereibacter sphaeroides 2.4.1]